MIPVSYPERLRSLRVSLRLTQVELAQRCGLPASRISAFENGARLPTWEQVLRIAGGLGLEGSELVSGTTWMSPEERADVRNASSEATRCFARPFPYQPPRDRSMAIQVKKAAAEWPDLIPYLLHLIGQRPDGGRTLRLLAEMVAGSSYEALVHLSLLVAGAVVVRVAPLAVGFRHRPVADPSTRAGVGDCEVVAYMLRHEAFTLLMFPQLGLACGRIWTVDFLCGVLWADGTIRWFVLEVDGPGHETWSDRKREADIDLPTLRLRPGDMEDGQAAQVILDRIERGLPAI